MSHDLIKADTTIETLAALVSEALQQHGIHAVLSGGAVVSIYTNNEFQSHDLDFITTIRGKEIDQAMISLGFSRGRGRHYEHPVTEFIVEFPSGPLMAGAEPIDRHAERHTPAGVIRLPRSSFFYHLARLEVADKYVEVRGAMIDIFDRNYRCYGYRRLHASLTGQSLKISEKIVRRLMKQESLVPVGRKRRRYGSYMGEISPAPDNLLNRDFSAEAPNEKWLTDITEFQIPAGKVYLSPMIDCYDGMVVSWSIGTRPDAELVNTMLDAAIETVAANSDRPVVHSDRGGHYRWPGWLSRIAGAKLVRSMSRKACSPDNAACEGFFGRLKTELFYSRDWLSTTIEEFVAALDGYVRWYNEVRIKMSLGYRSPMEYRRNLAIAA